MDNPKVTPLELAKQGNPNAIAALIARQVHSQGIFIKASKKNYQLQVLIEKSDVPNQSFLCGMIENGIKKINPEGIAVVKIYGKIQGEDFPCWDYSFQLNSESNPFDFGENPPPKDDKEKVSYFEAEGKNGKIRLTRKRIIISREGFWGFVSQGMAGTKEIPITNITAVQFKPAGKAFVGYLQFSVLGGVERQGGVFKAVEDENTVTFFEHQQPNFEEVKRYIDSLIDDEPIDLSDLKFNKVSVSETIADLERLRRQPHPTYRPIGLAHTKVSSDSPHPTDSSIGSRKWAAVILGVLLGSLGTHKFVLGYHIEGCVLFGITVLTITLGYTAIITFLIGIIEGLIYMFKTNEEFDRIYIKNKRGWF